MKIIAIIPARYSSSRLPGKPLLTINNKPMFYWVHKAALETNIFDEVIIATDDKRILESCKKHNIVCVLTSSKHSTGTDRVAEVAKNIEADIIVNIQGDEPMLEPNVIKESVLPIINDENIIAVNLMQEIYDPINFINNTVPKVVTDNNGYGLYLSRAAIPSPKGSIKYPVYKQVCVYAFRKSTLEYFTKTPRSKNEIIEDIEILRLLDNSIKVKFVEVKTESIAVDTYKDYELVKSIMETNQ